MLDNEVIQNGHKYLSKLLATHQNTDTLILPVENLVVDDHVIQGARPSAGIVLALFEGVFQLHNWNK